jgi:thiol:disulfide interchange protein DsbD
MYAATGWLLWVASQLTNSSGLGLIILGLLLVSISSWLIGKDYKKDYSKKINNTIVFLILLLAVSIPLSSNLSSENNSDVQNNNDTISETFSNEYLDELLNLGSPVFINFTAAWCITCIVNENVVLSDKDFIKALKDNNVTYLKADWTKRSKEISKTLEFYGRSGIPLYILYDREGNYRILNQILSKKVVLNILNKV